MIGPFYDPFATCVKSKILLLAERPAGPCSTGFAAMAPRTRVTAQFVPNQPTNTLRADHPSQPSTVGGDQSDEGASSDEERMAEMRTVSWHIEETRVSATKGSEEGLRRRSRVDVVVRTAGLVARHRITPVNAAGDVAMSLTSHAATVSSLLWTHLHNCFRKFHSARLSPLAAYPLASHPLASRPLASHPRSLLDRHTHKTLNQYDGFLI
jgi:hypothetical protein